MRDKLIAIFFIKGNQADTRWIVEDPFYNGLTVIVDSIDSAGKLEMGLLD